LRASFLYADAPKSFFAMEGKEIGNQQKVFFLGKEIKPTAAEFFIFSFALNLKFSIFLVFCDAMNNFLQSTVLRCSIVVYKS
jgi:hypothetical protein